MKEKIAIWISWHLPKFVVYWSTIRLMTTVNRNAPDDMKASEYLKAW